MTVLKIGGCVALSAFRLDKLNSHIHAVETRLTVTAARFWHFVEVDLDLDQREHATLVRLLTYGAPAPEPSGRLVLVTPRLGTVSPWSSKATDIARQCGLTSVGRIERGTLYSLEGAGKLRAVVPLLHDRMTETVLETFDQAHHLFHHLPPRPLTLIDVMSRGREAIEEANATFGLRAGARRDRLSGRLLRRPRAQSHRRRTDHVRPGELEHCRHKIFNASWVVDGERQPQSLFGMIRATHELNPQGTISAHPTTPQ